MLTHLSIRNYAIISELDLDLSGGLTIITGETGAGKSILLGALSLVLGKRADTSVLFSDEEKCVIEAHFDLRDYTLSSFFDKNDLDYEPVSILRREINSSGKSRGFINDTPVNLSQLRELASYLIDIHSQHEILTLKTPEFRARFLDDCYDGGKLFLKYREKHIAWLDLKKQVSSLKEQLQKAASDEDYLRFQLNELEELNLSEGELNTAQDRLTMLENAEEIRHVLDGVVTGLANSEDSVLDALRMIDAELKKLSIKYPKAAEWQERVHSSFLELEDLAREIELEGGDVDEDPNELLQLQERVDEILRLMTKHRKQSEVELLGLQNELSDQLANITVSDERLTLLHAELEKVGSELDSLGKELTSSRTVVAKELSSTIKLELHQLGMPDAELAISLAPSETTALGQDRIDIKFSSNRGHELQDVSKAASGGEISRLMLSVKSEMAKKAQLPAIIFDEIDTGVSGEVADKVGKKIKSMSERMQVLCITHLPQMASKADQHLFVYKENNGGKTVTKVKELDEQERILEIAKMLSSAEPTETAMTHAKDLIGKN